MERIKQALELARQERIKNGAQDGPITKTGHKRTLKSIEGQDITYSHSRTVALPVAELREKRIITEQQNSISDAYRMLRTQVLQRLNERDWSTLAITSPGSNAGKSLTAINLSISLAREVGTTVLLVDANLRSPKLDRYFDFHADYGLSDYLLDDKPLEDLLINPEGIPRFVVLPAGRTIANSSEMLSSARMQRLVEELKNRYPSRIVVFDMPPVLESSDTLAFIPYVDASLLVIEEGRTQETELKQSFELMQGNEVLGTVLNKAYTQDRDYAGLDVKQGWFSRWLSKISHISLSRKAKRNFA